ncbi:dephospho-CoA kinase [Gleimia coleocanis]|nr:dephospho-CoA kinase [Gleimia coleocanis]
MHLNCEENHNPSKTLSRGLWVGLTGGIGSGKSTVTKLLAQYGATIADADLIARAIVSRPTVLTDIAQIFGTDVVIKTATGKPTLNRAKLASIVFNDPQQLAKLNALTHPRIAQTALEILKTVEPGKVGVYDAAILLDYGRPTCLDIIVVVTAPTEVRIKRLVETRGMELKDAKARIANQITDQQRAQHADYIIDNSSDLTALTASVQQLWHAIQQHPKLQDHSQMEPSDG